MSTILKGTHRKFNASSRTMSKMAKPFFRYLPAKLKPMSAPAVWIPLAIFTLLSILLWEYYQNPEWFERDAITNANPESTLTPDEQAKLSEIDTVDLLLKGAQVTGPLSGFDELDAIESDSNEGSAELGLSDSGASASNTGRQLANRSDPFGSYAAEYEFPGANRASTSAQNPAPSPGTSPIGIPPVGSASTRSTSGNPQQSIAPSAFSDAIERQEALRTGDREPQPANSAPNRTTSTRSPINSSVPLSPTEELNATIAPQAPSSVSVPFIRTTPAMSPPAGTTGYPAPFNPPSFNTTAPQPIQSPTLAPIAPGQIGTVQTAPVARPIQPNQTPGASTLYTAPRSVQPEQNRRAR